MNSWSGPWLAVTLLGALWPAPARPCGPDFPPYLFASREATLASLLDGQFHLEAMRLVPAADRFQVVTEEPPDARDGGGEEERALYRAGAAAFRANNHEEAIVQFQEILKLPPEERARFGPMAAYMLGRLEGEAPAERYRQVREFVRAGASDPLGLAAASLGQEARVAFEAGNDVAAVNLYAQQAALGDARAAVSLLFVARAIAADEARTVKALADPVCQRLLATYAWTRGQETWFQGEQDRRPDPALLDRLAAAPKLAGADRLAAAAWMAGRFELAERFAGKEPTPLDAWVRAKVALRKGDRAGADALLAEAARGYPATEEWGNRYAESKRPRQHLEAERAILALVRGDFLAAMERALAGCAWQEIAYVGEQVLTVDELKAVVDRGGAQAACGPRPKVGGEGDDEWSSWEGRDLDAQLRAMLARRLLRARRDTEALRYFQGSEHEERAKAFVAARQAVDAATRDVDRAEALFALGRLTRRDGMELLGTEMHPDWAWVGGAYDLDGYHSWAREAVMGAEGVDGGLAADPTLLADGERGRITAAAPAHPDRFHYRPLAADLAEQAARLVPVRSQAYAALLCHAGRWSKDRAPALWKTYVKNGALVSGMVFGETCPEPDFARVRNPKPPKPPPPLWKRYRKRQVAPFAAGGFLALAGLVSAVVLLRRRSPPAQGK